MTTWLAAYEISWYSTEIRVFCMKKMKKQAGAELGQAQLKLGLDFNSIDFTFTLI